MAEWDRLVGEPLAHRVGPFPCRPFLERCARWSTGDLHVVSAPGAAMALFVTEGVARFAGESNLTDYHSPLGSAVDELVATAVSELEGVAFHLDSLPGEAAAAMQGAFVASGRVARRRDDEVCRLLDLADIDPEAWESALSSKHRHELRRKRRRFQQEAGTPEFASGSDYFDAFVRLHRMAEGEKGGFMSEAMEEFFANLLDIEGARLDVLLAGDDVAAAAFGFEDDGGYYLYNSAYHPAMRGSSPGIVLIDHLVKQTLRSGRTRFDFLKGAEDYKRRLGAVDRPLFRIEVSP